MLTCRLRTQCLVAGVLSYISVKYRGTVVCHAMQSDGPTQPYKELLT